MVLLAHNLVDSWPIEFKMHKLTYFFRNIAYVGLLYYPSVGDNQLNFGILVEKGKLLVKALIVHPIVVPLKKCQEIPSCDVEQIPEIPPSAHILLIDDNPQFIWMLQAKVAKNLRRTIR